MLLQHRCVHVIETMFNTILIILNIIFSGTILLYIVVAKAGIFHEARQQLQIARNKHESGPIEISTPNVFIWRITQEDWGYEGEARLSIVFQRSPSIPFEKYQREQYSLRIKVSARGMPTLSTSYERQIHDWYYNTNDPLSAESKMWAVWSAAEVEYGIAEIFRRSRETLVIEVSVTSPDTVLARAGSKLRIVGEHYASQLPWAAFFSLCDKAGLAICISVLILMNLFFILFAR